MVTSNDRNTAPTNAQREMSQGLTGGWLVAVVSVSEVLRILHHWNTSHPYDNRIRTCVQSTRSNDPMVDVMKRAGRVFFTTDHSHRAWKETEG